MVAPFKRIQNSILPSGTSWIFQFHHVNQFHCRLTQLRYCMAIPDDEATLWKAYKSFTANSANLQKIPWSLEIFSISASSWPLTLPPVFFWAKWYPFQWQHWWATRWTWKMVVFFQRCFLSEVFNQRGESCWLKPADPQRLVRRFFLLAQQGDPWIPMVLRRQPFLSKKVDRCKCKWVGNHNHKQKTLISTFGPTSFTNSIGFFCWIFESLQPFIIPPIFLEDQPTTHGPNLNPRSFPRHLATCAASTSSATAQPAAFDAALLRMDLPASTKARVQRLPFIQMNGLDINTWWTRA